MFKVPLYQRSPYYVTNKDTKLDCGIGAIMFSLVTAALWHFGYLRAEDPTPEPLFIGGIFLFFALIAYARRVFEKEDVILFLDRERKRTMLSIPRAEKSSDVAAFLEAVVSRIPMPQAKPLAEAPVTEIAHATNTPGT